MPSSYQTHVANGNTTNFSFSQIDGYLSTSFIKVYLNGVLQNSGYSFIDLSTVTPKISFSTAPTATTVVTIKRETPKTSVLFKNNVVDFQDGSILTAKDLDRGVAGLLHLIQESVDSSIQALGLTFDGNAWDAINKEIKNLGEGSDFGSAATLGQVQALIDENSGNVPKVGIPQAWDFVGDGTTKEFSLTNPDPAAQVEEMFIVEVNGTISKPITDYTINNNTLSFGAAPANNSSIVVRNFGFLKSVVDSVGTSQIQDGAITSSKIADNSVLYSKIQTVASDKLLGNPTGSTGNVQEITCTSFARTLLDDVSAAAARSTLVIPNTDVVAAPQPPNTLVGNLASNSAIPVSNAINGVSKNLLVANGETNIRNAFVVIAKQDRNRTLNSNTFELPWSSDTVTQNTFTSGVFSGVTIPVGCRKFKISWFFQTDNSASCQNIYKSGWIFGFNGASLHSQAVEINASRLTSSTDIDSDTAYLKLGAGASGGQVVRTYTPTSQYTISGSSSRIVLGGCWSEYCHGDGQVVGSPPVPNWTSGNGFRFWGNSNWWCADRSRNKWVFDTTSITEAVRNPSSISANQYSQHFKNSGHVSFDASNGNVYDNTTLTINGVFRQVYGLEYSGTQPYGRIPSATSGLLLTGNTLQASVLNISDSVFSYCVLNYSFEL